MPKFFIDHPVFAWVVAILISLGGVISILNLGVESYPSVAPPQVTVSATYPGASAATADSRDMPHTMSRSTMRERVCARTA